MKSHEVKRAQKLQSATKVQNNLAAYDHFYKHKWLHFYILQINGLNTTPSQDQEQGQTSKDEEQNNQRVLLKGLNIKNSS